MRSVVAAVLLGAGCAPSRVAPPPAAPTVERPVDAIPADLDLVVRVDLGRMRAALGASVTSELAARAAAKDKQGVDRGTELMLADALAKTDTAWLAMRPGLTPEHSDNVIVLRGNFQDMELRRAGSEPPWELPRDLGGGFRRYDRKAPKVRAAPARIYARGDELIVLVSEAEIDSVERAIEERRGDPPLEPPEKGAVSLAVRLPGLVEKIGERAPTFAKFLQGAERGEANADLASDGLHAEVAIEFEDDARAERVGSAVRQIVEIGKRAEGRVGRLAKGLEVERAGSFVSARFALGAADFAELLECGRSGCAW